MDDTRPFPIQAEGLTRPGGIRPGRSAIPWWLAELAYDYYSKRFGTSQTLERLAARGGFGRAELVALIRREGEGEVSDGRPIHLNRQVP